MNVESFMSEIVSLFGGWSQIVDRAVGQALRGRYRNYCEFEGLTLEETVEMAVEMIAAQWPDEPVSHIRTEVRLGAGLD